MSLQRKGTYRQILVSNERLGQYDRLHKWVSQQPVRRDHAQVLSIADAMLDVTMGYLDLLEGKRKTRLARNLLSTIGMAGAKHYIKGLSGKINQMA